MDNVYYIEAERLKHFIAWLNENHRVFAPAVKDPDAAEPDYFYAPFGAEKPLVFNAYRTVEPLKTFFIPSREAVVRYFGNGNDAVQAQKTVVFGVKACDIAAHKVQDFVFLEGTEQDAFYKARRDNTIFISGDCTSFKETCFCLAWDIMPHPVAGFDLNLSPLTDGFLVEAGSDSGRKLLQQHREYFTRAKETQVSARKVKRDNVIRRMMSRLKPQNLPSKGVVQRLVKEGYNLDTWKKFMLTCVECGGCNFICDTCHCFLLHDAKDAGQNSKVRLWDSCQYANFCRVAGGANPLKTRTQRLRNRFMKKFDFFVDNLNMPACCGCGRCIEVCPGKIDLREVLKDLAVKLGSAQ